MKIELELQKFLINSSYLATLPNYYFGGYECDLFTLNNNLFTTEYEIKRSKADYEKDFNKSQMKYGWLQDKQEVLNTKHGNIKDGKRTNRFFFVLPENLIVEIPDYAGVIRFSENGRCLFQREKQAPRIHKRQIDIDTIKDLLLKSNWRLYQQIRRYDFISYNKAYKELEHRDN